MARMFPQIEPVRELRSTLAELRLNRLNVGADGRVRCSLMPFASKTSRNQPSSAGYVFGPAKWIRFLIRPARGRVLVHRDYSQQEIVIAAVLSGDRALLDAAETGDVYMALAKEFGHAAADATAETHPDVRKRFKIIALAINYGMAAPSLAQQTGLSLSEAGELLTQVRLRYRRFWEFAERVANGAGLDLAVCTGFGWRMRTPPGRTNPRTIRNFPMQAGGAEILRAACILAESRGIEIIAPVHDALMAEGPAEDAADLSRALDQAMGDAGQAVLQGYRLRTDVQLIRHTGRFFDARGEQMWARVNALLDQLERRYG
jgi:DNA polymerase I-like protein with 3'-5' exonuclease and polymerase domains